MTKRDVLEEFTSLKGVGKAKAELLYKNGFTSVEKLKKASIKELVLIKGITESLAKNIIDQLEEKKTVPGIKKEKVDTKVEPTKIPMDAKFTESEKPTPPVKKEEEEVRIIEEDEYKAKQKPILSFEIQQRLRLRKQIKKRTPKFLREEWFRYKRISQNWRKPDGITSKMRINRKYRPNMARVGYRGPRETLGLHSSGFREIIIHNIHDIEMIDPKTQAARIGKSVGIKKRLEIEKKADELGIRILNRG